MTDTSDSENVSPRRSILAWAAFVFGCVGFVNAWWFIFRFFTVYTGGFRLCAAMFEVMLKFTGLGFLVYTVAVLQSKGSPSRSADLRLANLGLLMMVFALLPVFLLMIFIR